MANILEWAHAFAGRLHENDTESFMARHNEMALRLQKEASAGHLPYLTMPYKARLEEELEALSPWLCGFRHMLLLGIGGSALGARALQRAFAPGQDGPGHTGRSLWIADNVCGKTLETWLERLNPSETVVVCISKSGGTIETLAQYFIVKQWLQGALGENWSGHTLLITDAQKGFLREEAQQFSLRSLEVPDHLGGRYSALSAVGMVPAAFLGMDWRGLLDGAAEVARPLCENPASLKDHAAFRLACWASALAEKGYSQLIFFCYIPAWATLGPWFAQLWAESLGKEGKGTMPLPAVGVTDQHSTNQMFLDGPRDKGCLFLTSASVPQEPFFASDVPAQWNYLRNKPFGSLLEAEALGTCMALSQSQVPLVRIHMGESAEKEAGALMLLLETATILTGWLLDINPIDQPAVELGKRLANARLGAQGYVEEEKALAAYLSIAERRQEF